MISYLTVQTDVDLQNIRPVSDLGPHIENQSKRSDSIWFVLFTLSSKKKKTLPDRIWATFSCRLKVALKWLEKSHCITIVCMNRLRLVPDNCYMWLYYEYDISVLLVFIKCAHKRDYRLSEGKNRLGNSYINSINAHFFTFVLTVTERLVNCIAETKMHKPLQQTPVAWVWTPPSLPADPSETHTPPALCEGSSHTLNI